MRLRKAVEEPSHLLDGVLQLTKAGHFLEQPFGHGC
jgi:hypothetical protein